MQKDDNLPAIEKRITQGQIERYAVASGDFNPIHVDREFAATLQFGGTIAHGMLIAASISEMMTEAFHEDWVRGGKMKIRFKAPVYPDEEITTFGTVKGIRERDGTMEVTCSVGVHKQDGETAIIGDATVEVPAPR